MPLLKIAQTVDGTPKAWEVEVGDREATLGRDRGCTIPLEDKAVSRSHARIVPTAQGIRLRDLGSSNGTWVNGLRISEVLLKDGDEIRLGGCVIRFILPLDQAKTVMLGSEELKSYLPSPAPQAPAPAAIAPPPPPPAFPPPAPQSAPPPPTHSPSPAFAPPPLPNYATPPLPPLQRPRFIPPPSPSPQAHAGFWIRLLAYLLDSVILTVPMLILSVPAYLFLRSFRHEQGKFIAAVVGMYGLMAALGLLYLLFFWAVKGATPGKMILGLRIVREDGVEPPGWWTAFLRFLGYIVDGLTLYIGFIMIAFTDRKRGLHDMIAGTTVVKTR